LWVGILWAGREKGGIENISPDLFQNAPYILCPPRTGKIPDILINIIRAIGSRIILLSPEFHDRYIASISHLPQLLAVGLLSDTAEMDHETKKVILEIAGMGFQDMTRIGESPFGIWKDILAENRENTLDSLNSLIRKLVLYRSFLQKGEIDLFKGEFEKARGI
jgi:prephenate dehydrogenase